MRACLVISCALALSGCLDFDVFKTEPATSSSSAGGGGAGGEGGDGGAGGMGSTSSSSSSSTGGMGGAGGGGLQPCGNLIDDFDGGADLPWDVQSGSFMGDQAVTMPPNSIFTLNESQGTTLSDCFVQVEVVQDSDGLPFFGWLNVGSPARVLKFITNPSNQVFVQLSPDSGGASDLPVLDASLFTTGVVRISEERGNYVVQTAPSSMGPWTVRVSLPVASAPTWLSMPGRPYFGVEGNGTSAVFDNFNTP